MVFKCGKRYSRRVFVIEGQYSKKALLDNTNNQQIHITKRKYKKNLEEDIQKKNIQKKTNRNRKSPVLVKDIQENPRLSQED